MKILKKQLGTGPQPQNQLLGQLLHQLLQPLLVEGMMPQNDLQIHLQEDYCLKFKAVQN